MEELFRFIQQAVVVPSEVGQLDLTTDSPFQRELRQLVADGRPYGEVRSRAERFLAGVVTSDLRRLRGYGVLRDTVLALTVPITDERVNRAVKDVFGKAAFDLSRSADFLADKQTSSDVLVAVKITSRFDRVDVAAVTVMRRVIGFVEDVAAGRATVGWHQFQLASTMSASVGGGVASVSRTPTEMDVCWIGTDGSVRTAAWTQDSGWKPGHAVAEPGSAATGSGLAAVSRDPDHQQAWWIGSDGSVRTAAWLREGGWQPMAVVADPGSAAAGSGIAAVSRSPGHLEVWWVKADGSVHGAFWTAADPTWRDYQVAPAGSASAAGGVAAVSRAVTHMEVWWIRPDGAVLGAWWIEGAPWHDPYLVADRNNASAAGGIAVLTRSPSHMELWWIGKDGSVQDAWWTKAGGWHAPFPVARPASAAATAAVTALTRSSTHMEVWWIGPDGAVADARWNEAGGWHEPYLVADANSASVSGGLASVSRAGDHMELWWAGKDGSVQDAWWLAVTPPTTTEALIRSLLDRPLHVPVVLLPPPGAPAPGGGGEEEPPGGGTEPPTEEHDAFRRAFEALMAARPAQLAITTLREGTEPGLGLVAAAEVVPGLAAVRTTLAFGKPILAGLDEVVTEQLRRALEHPEAAPMTDVLDVVKRRWLELAREVEPHRVPAPARTFRLGANVFAVAEPAKTATAAAEAGLAPEPRHAVLRPVGVGDLQVVRQRLIGYEATDVSHIENVLPGELLRRSITREETTELTVVEETETSQRDERDTQTTDRNELVSEAQKEASVQSATTSDQTSTSSYGRLVENSKSNYARSVTDRAVSTLTHTVREQRMRREKTVFTDKAVHQLDNSTGRQPVRGIYQWVDKLYQVQVCNYGKRLLYDVVLPEPAAFLIKTLKDAAQPENFQLTKPAEPTLLPTDLHAGNYTLWAARYGVSAAVGPPPEEVVTTFAETNADFAGKVIDAYGKKFNSQFYGSFKIHVPEGYAAIGGFVQRTNVNTAPEVPVDDHKRQLEFFIGENTFVRFAPADVDFLNQSFRLNAETGDIPVTVGSFTPTLQFNYAVGIRCRRTDKAYEQWQLKTHAAIVAGYQRQRTNYLDELARYQAALRSQMALAQGFSRDTTMERQELKKAFLLLLMSEHFGEVYHPAPNPTAFPPDAGYITSWGAVAAFFERAFEWEHLMYLYYPYFWGRRAKWGELIVIQDLDPEFEAFLKAGAARVVVPVRPGFEAALAHYHETGDVWMGEEIPDMFSDQYVSIIAEIKARDAAPGDEEVVEQWQVRLPTTLVLARTDGELPAWPAPAALDAGS